MKRRTFLKRHRVTDEQDRKDAERYRFLRKIAPFNLCGLVYRYAAALGHDDPDLAIDAAMQDQTLTPEAERAEHRKPPPGVKYGGLLAYADGESSGNYVDGEVKRLPEEK